MRYLVPSTSLQCEEELNAVTKCYEAFNARKRSELMANMNKPHHNIPSNRGTSIGDGTSVNNETLTQAELMKCAPLAKALRRCVDLTLSAYSSQDNTEDSHNDNEINKTNVNIKK